MILPLYLALFISWVAWELTRDYLDTREINRLRDEEETEDRVAWLRSMKEFAPSSDEPQGVEPEFYDRPGW